MALRCHLVADEFRSLRRGDLGLVDQLLRLLLSVELVEVRGALVRHVVQALLHDLLERLFQMKASSDIDGIVGRQAQLVKLPTRRVEAGRVQTRLHLANCLLALFRVRIRIDRQIAR